MKQTAFSYTMICCFLKEETGWWVLNPVKVNWNAFISTDGRLSVNNLWGKQASFN